LTPQTARTAVEQYATRFAEIDRSYLSLHQVWAEGAEDEVFGLSLQELVQSADGSYRSFADSLQNGFVAAVSTSSWPASELPRQVEVYDRYLAPAVAKGDLTAYVLVDGLRYDLAKEVLRILSAGLSAQVHAACAQLPTKTEVGMAALLPQSAGELRVDAGADGLSVTVAGEDVSTAPKRDEYYQRHWGDRCKVMTLDELLALGPRKRLPENVKLVVVRDSGIDKAGEADGKRLPAALPGAITQIAKAVHKLRALGARLVVIAADHGFIYAPAAGPGDVVAKPNGDWVVAKDRFLLGRGESSPHTVRFAPRDVGVPCDAEALVFPRSLGTFQAGTAYYHGGLSLQECVVPVICIEMPEVTRKPTRPVLVMTYRGKGTGRITARVFTVELSCPGTPLIQERWAEDTLQVQLVVHRESSPEEVGRVMPGDHVDASTLLVRISSGESIKVPLRMVEAFRGRFTVKALDPVALTRLAEVTLETDYME